MAVKQLSIGGPDFGGHYSGLSGDTKPTANIGDLATFWETDTGFLYTWSGSAWVLSPYRVQPSFSVDPDDSSRQGKFDELQSMPVVISEPHYEVHEGGAFVVSTVDITLDNAATMILAFKTMAGTKRAHMLTNFTTLTGGHVDLIEGPAWTAESGSTIAIFNRKREASMGSSGLLENSDQAAFTATDTVILNPTGLSGGTIIHILYGFGQKNQFTASGRDVEEILLKPDTQYAARFVSDAASNKALLELNWYEHTDE